MLGTDNSPFYRELQKARKRLLETGSRNRLIHVNRKNRRANQLEVINELSDEIYRILRKDGHRMKFKAMGKDLAENSEGIELAATDDSSSDSNDRHTDRYLETPLSAEQQARRLLRIYMDARSAQEEQGLNVLYLAMGFLSWKENTNSEVLREAPLILVPVQLVRNNRTSTFDIESRDEEMSVNLSLKERLKNDFGVELPEIDETDESTEWTPSLYFKEVNEAISNHPNWSIDKDGMLLGFFSFAKLLMLRDLDPDAERNKYLTDSALLRSILTNGFEPKEPIFGHECRIDELMAPEDLIQVIDADASQTKIIEEVRKGENLVVEGPPGTGKSQTITNIIAAAVHDGKTVLFVAEKMAALSVVHDRLVREGLEHVCVELHSRKANKKEFLEKLGRTLKASEGLPGSPSSNGQLKHKRDRLNRISEILHTPIAPSDETPHFTLSELISLMGRNAQPPLIDTYGLHTLNREKRERAYNAISRFADAFQSSGATSGHPFHGTRYLELQPFDIPRLENELKRASSATYDLLQEVDTILENLRIIKPRSLDRLSALANGIQALSDPPADVETYATEVFENIDNPRLIESLRIGTEWAEKYKSAETVYSASAWGSDVHKIRATIARGLGSFFSRLSGPYRRASKELSTLLVDPIPSKAHERLKLLDRLVEIQNRRKALAEEESWLEHAMGQQWRGERTPFDRLLANAEWLTQVAQHGIFPDADRIIRALKKLQHPDQTSEILREKIEDTLRALKIPLNRLDFDIQNAGYGNRLESCDLQSLSKMLSTMANEIQRYHEWVELKQSERDAIDSGAGNIVEFIYSGKLDPSLAIQEFAYACAEERWRHAITTVPVLKECSQWDRKKLVEEYQDLDRNHFKTTRDLILSQHLERMPQGSSGQMGIIRGEMKKKRRHMAIRQLMKNTGSVVQKIKPVMLMSPISVAQFLPPKSLHFDILVMDEASQIRPEEALGCIARADQIVVVGDEKQLPPTSFFDRITDEYDDEANDEDSDELADYSITTETESILSLCGAKGIRSRMLEWHYRSKDPSLIQVSNAEFYQDRLILPPSPLTLDQNYGLKFRKVPGVYARRGSGLGREGTNRIEAQEIVNAVAQHARDWPTLSLGIVAFSKHQADLITELLEHSRRSDHVLDNFLREDNHENVFVKNIENVQGDERDVIFISVCYGPQEPYGQLKYLQFGPVNKEGGERRLNVLFSRSRMRCEVFASFEPGDIVASRVKSKGPMVLKRFLEFAKTGILADLPTTGENADSPFEEDVASVIKALGYSVDLQVGTGGFKIDLGVKHPVHQGQYMLAVECDGATYHSALWARERDRLRQQILEGLGWRFHRIWSTDWFYDRDKQINHLRQVLESTQSESTRGIIVKGANHDKPTDDSQSKKDTPTPVHSIAEIEPTANRTPLAPLYQKATIHANNRIEPHEARIYDLVPLIREVVSVEGPIHRDEIARRIAGAYGKNRTGSRINDRIQMAVSHLLRIDAHFIEKDCFIMTDEQASNPPLRNRSNFQSPDNLLKIQYISPLEIIEASKISLQHNGDMPRDQLIRAIANLFGFGRTGKDISDRIGVILDHPEQHR